MKVICKIAKAELRQLFCSPIAWLVLIIFTVQSGMAFVENMERWISMQESRDYVRDLTYQIFANVVNGVFVNVQQYLYLYIPLLTMGLISKEKSSGSIKLLFSSPINNTQIVLGKFTAMVSYALVLMGVLMIYGLFAYFSIKDFDTPHFLSAMLGLFLLTCAYSAIGLFLSSLTSYQVVAVVSTLALLTVMNLLGEFGQEVPVLRDIAYWLSLKGRSGDMLRGLINSEDVIYFLLIIFMFIMLSIFKLNNERRRLSRTMGFVRYAVLLIVVFLVGRLSTLPSLMFYCDTTATKTQTLHPTSQEIMSKMDGPLTITTYVNLLDPFYNRAMPSRVNSDKKKFRQYTRFKPEIKMKYVYYWDTAENPHLSARFGDKTDQEKVNQLSEELLLDLDLFMTPEEFQRPEIIAEENNRFVRVLERGNGEKTVLRIFGSNGEEPKEEQISAAMRRLVSGASRLAFLTGHGENSIYRIGEKGFYNITLARTSEKALINNGFDVFEINLKEQRLDFAKVDILVVSAMKEPWTEDEFNQIKQYLDNGGNMIIAGEPGNQEWMNPLLEELGVQFMPGRIMHNNPDVVSNVVLATPTKASEDISWTFRWMNRWNYKSPMLNAVGVDYSKAAEKGVETFVVMTTDSVGTAWNELTNISPIETKAEFNPEKGEVEGSFAMAVRVSRQVGEKEQRILVCGDTDWMTNGEQATRRTGINTIYEHLLETSLHWMTYDNYPVEIRRPNNPDDKLFIGGDSVLWMKLAFWFLLPLAMLVGSITIQVTRKRK